MTRDEALKLLDQKLSNKNLIKHSLAAEAVMREVADHFGKDREVWGMAGLLHDYDYEETNEFREKHGLVTEELLKKYELTPEIIMIIKGHNSEALGIERKSLGEDVIFAVDPVTGLITAATLMVPTKKLKGLQLSSLLKRFKDPRFARGANREHIKTCENFGVTLEDFLSISLKAMQKIDHELGL